MLITWLQDFVYPDGVAFPVGGVGNSEYLVLEMHYDNPGLVPGDIRTASRQSISHYIYLFFPKELLTAQVTG